MVAETAGGRARGLTPAQVCGGHGVFSRMETYLEEFPQLAVLASVRCLSCGEVYSKPVAGGTVHKNPGCPECAYVGWIPVSLPPERSALPRFGGGPLPLRPLPAR